MDVIKKALKAVKKYGITFWLLAALLATAGIVVHARYTDNRNYAKRVVATQKGSKSFFTSNYMSPSVPQHFKAVASGESAPQSFDVSIYNYDINNPGISYATDIDYDLTVSFRDGTGTRALSSSEIAAIIGTDRVELYALTGSTPAATPFLTADKDSSAADRTAGRTVTVSSGADSFRMILPISMKDKDICVKLTATPSGYSDLPPEIGSVFAIKTQTFTAMNGWHGAFDDNRSKQLSAYDGFNYNLTGNGVSEGVLSWNNTLVEPNMKQINEIKASGASVSTSGSISSITVSLDPTDNGGRYDLQFFVTGRSAVDAMSWTAFADSVSGAVTFVESSGTP